MSLVYPKISACLVVYNEEAVIERCLKSIKNLVDEIIVVHDGECSDKTLELAKKYTDKIFIREHVGIAEPHRAFTYEQASNPWVLQLDADEYIDDGDQEKVRSLVLVSETGIDAFAFKWEMWNGQRAIHIGGARKMCLFRKEKFSFHGLPQEIGHVVGKVENIDIWLRHRPGYNNLSWKEFFRKANKWIPIHATYFFPEKVNYNCFNGSPDKCIEYTKKVKNKIWYYILFQPFKMSLGQLKNGLWKTRYGILVSLEHYFYYLKLYKEIKRELDRS